MFDNKEKGKGTVKFIDFGLACQFNPRNKQQSIVGTAYFMAPEVLDRHYNQ